MRFIICLMTIALFMSGCGRKGPLIYPEMTAPAAPPAVSASQAGKSLRLSITMPQKDQAGRRLNDLGGVTIFRRAAAMGSSPSCSACTEGFSLLMKLYLDLPFQESGVQRFGSQLVLLDSSVRVGDEYSYTVTPFTKDSQDGLTSLPVTTVMLPPPSAPQVIADSQPTEIRLSFSSSAPREGVLLGYNLYRAQKGETLPHQPINKEPILGKRYVDIGLDRNLSYVYAARTVIKTAAGKVVESELSNTVGARLTND